jgi:hypothetical protein
MTAVEPARRPAPRSRGGDPAPGLDVEPGRAGTAHPLAALQETFGNLGVVRRLADPAVQARLEIGAPDDDYEREADRVAASIMRRPEPPAASADPQVQRRAEDDDKKKAAPPPQRAPGAAQKAAPAPAPKPPATPEAKKPAEAQAPKKPEPPKKAETPTTVPPPQTKKPEPKKPEPKKPDAKKPDEKRKEPPKQPQAGAGKKREDETVARKPAGGRAPSLTPAASRTIQSQQGAGQPLSAADRGFFEPWLGHDLGAVRVHDDSAARGAARDISAQAFTYGQDVYFGAGRYQPGTESGRELLAHELAHTVQQRPGARIERRVQRAEIGKPSVGVYDDTQQLLKLPSVKVPSFKKDRYGRNLYADGQAHPMRRKKVYNAASRPDQRADWRRDITTAASETVLQQRVAAQPQAGPYNAGTTYQWRTPLGQVMNATVPRAARDWRLPGWNRADQPRTFEVDHLRELQLADWPATTAAWANTRENWALLQDSANGRSGSLLRSYINDATKTFVGSNDPDAVAVRQAIANIPSALKPNPTRDQVPGQASLLRRTVSVEFSHADSEAFSPAVTELDYWTADEIEQGAHLRHVRLNTLHAPTDPNKVEVLPLPEGGTSRLFNVGSSSVPASNPAALLLQPLRVTAANLPAGEAPVGAGAKIGSITAHRPAGGHLKETPPRELDVKQLGTAARVGYVDRDQLQGMLTTLEIAELSPIEVTELGMGAHGITLRGRIAPTIEPIRRANIQLVIDGDDISIEKQFSAEELEVPAPLRIDEATLTLFVSSRRGVGASGSVFFGIERVGSGQLDATLSTAHGFGFDGRFLFDSATFTRAELGIHYHDSRWSGEGVLEIGAGKVPGVRRAHLDLGYEAGAIHGRGNADFDIPGVRSGEVHFDYSAEHGLTIGGTLTVGAIPGIREGTLSATLSERPDGSGYKLAAHGSATAAIPGFEAQLVIDYDDGAFLGQITLPVHRGLIEGEITLGATNRPLDENNRPIPNAQPLPDIHIFGSGTASMQITPWLRGTATVKLLENGELEVDGTLSVPGVNLWPEVAPEPTTLIHPPDLEFPIFGPVVLTFGGHLDLKYGLSAGVLSGSLSVHYNPSHEDQTHLHGAIHLHASAYAGLELDVDVGIALDALVGSIGGSIELGAEVRADASVDPDIQIDWTPSAGFVIDPVFDAAVTPKLLFHIRARVTASLAFWSKTWTKDLAEYPFGSSLALSVHLPAHYDEAHGFSVDWNRLEFHHPDIHPLDMAKDFIEELV